MITLFFYIDGVGEVSATRIGATRAVVNAVAIGKKMTDEGAKTVWKTLDRKDQWVINFITMQRSDDQTIPEDQHPGFSEAIFHLRGS